MEHNKSIYITNNIALASAFIAKDVKLDAYSKEGNITYFSFPNKNNLCNKYESLWFTDQLEVKAFSYFQALKQLKNIVYKGRSHA